MKNKLTAIVLFCLWFCVLNVEGSSGKPLPPPTCTLCDDKRNGWIVTPDKREATQKANSPFVNINTCEKSSSRKKRTWCFISSLPLGFPLGSKSRYIGVVQQGNLVYTTGGTKPDVSYWYADNGDIYGYLNSATVQKTTGNPTFGYKDTVCVHFLGKRKMRFSKNGQKVGQVVKLQKGQFFASYYAGGIQEHNVICTYQFGV